MRGPRPRAKRVRVARIRESRLMRGGWASDKLAGPYHTQGKDDPKTMQM